MLITTVTAQQIRHFAEFGWIEFEHFLRDKECAEIGSAIEQTLARRLHSDKLTRFNADRVYAAGRDCWREEPLLKHYFLSQRFAATAATLANKKPLLLACDQWIPFGKILLPQRMNEQLSFQNLVCGILLSLEEGRARFLKPERLPLFTTAQHLIAYGSTNTVYIHNPADPSNALLKDFGYSFNDRLKTDHHPICKTES
jgi:hypothetical protein